jgi:murein DD-endopeptidase MepM/ murein hydrolase activator NlpD
VLAAGLALAAFSASAGELAAQKSPSRLASSVRSARSSGDESGGRSRASSATARREHTVAEGESLWTIARRYGVSVDDLREANDLTGTTLRPGRKLRIPRAAAESRTSTASSSRGTRAARREHTVGSGESLWTIARRYDVSVDALQEVNDLDDVTIQPGQKLRIPGAAAAERTASSARRETRGGERAESRAPATRKAARPRAAEREESTASRSGSGASRTASSAKRRETASEERESRTGGERRLAVRATRAERGDDAREEAPSRLRGAPTAHLAAMRMLIPVQGIEAAQLRNSYDEARSEGRVHDAIDIHAPRGTPVLAVTDGRVLRFHRGARGGNSIYLLDGDGRTRYYYAHLDGYAPGLEEGDEVRRGQVIGYVGDTGNAAPGDYHLHFSIAILNDTRHWWQGSNVNPFPLLRKGETER